MDSEFYHDYDCLIIGAGLSGICSLIHIRERFPAWRVKVIEAGESVGGTWYWNNYPGARFDSESLSYGYSFDQELLDEWHWKEAFSAQPDTLRYIQRVAEKHDLYKDIKFNTRIRKAHWQNDVRMWALVDEQDVQYRTKFLVSCIGFLSSPTLPNIPGINCFKGQAFHTSRWPKQLDLQREFSGKRIGVIGTGATGIQTITELAKLPDMKSLTVFQRTANWSAPLRNTDITPEEMAQHRREYPLTFKRCAETPMCFIHQADPRKSSDVTAEERLALWEKIYSEPGMSKWLGAFKDTYTDREANRLYSDFMAEKIRARIRDPATANKLIPRNHGFGTRRVPLESGYFESFNKPHVHLIDLQETPIEMVTETGIRTSDGSLHELDVLVFATGFDAITGAFRSIDWQVKDGRPLLGATNEKAVWVDQRPKTFLGLTAPSVPNMFMVLGPHQPFGNATRTIEHAVDVVTSLLQYCNDNGYTYVEPTEQAVEEWTSHVFECAQGSLANEIDSWMTGVNKNVKGKHERTVARYAGSAIEYRRRCEKCKEQGWKGLVFA